MIFDVFIKVFSGAVDMLFRPPFSYFVLFAIILLSIFTIARTVLRIADLGSLEHQAEFDGEEQEEQDEDDEDDVEWYISADDFTTWNEEDHQI